MKKIWIIANWKANVSLEDALNWVEEVGPQLVSSEDLVIGVCPRFSSLSEVAKSIKVGNYPILVGSQNISPFIEGAFTGEEPASLLKSFISFSLVGHSERRHNFAETDEVVKEKVKRLIEQELMPLICVQDAQTPIPFGVKIVAYEPVFAIGTGTPDTPENANSVAKMIKEVHGADLQVLYGGSVNADNCEAFLKQEHISGLLIGKSSLDSKLFTTIANLASGIVQ